MERAELIAELIAGATVVTANDRLARRLHAQVAEHRIAQGHTVWGTPRALTLAALLGQHHEALCASGNPTRARVLSSHEAEALWEKVIEGSVARLAADGGARGPLLQVRALAALADEARGLVLRHRLGFGTAATPSGALGLDAREFALWHEVYGRRLDEQNSVDAHALPDLIAEAWRAKHVPPPARVIFEGYDETTPQLTALMDALEAGGAQVTRPAVRHLTAAELAARAIAPAPHAERVQLADARHEIEAAAAWAAAHLRRDAEARIGIVVRDLATHRQTVIDALDAMLDPASMVLPEAAGSDTASSSPIYNLSLGKPLASWPLVHDALRCLRLAGPEVEWRDASGVLRSPFFAPGDDAGRRQAAGLELWIRGHLPERFALDALVQGVAELIDEGSFEADPGFAILSEAFRAHRPAPHERRPPGAWCTQAARLLHAAGWPDAAGARPFDHAERQSLEAWDDALREVGRMERTLGEIGWPQFLSRLTAVCQATDFQPRAPGGQHAFPIQVLGYLEGAVLDFDALWVMGMDDESWPPAARPNPLLPIALQKERITPGSSAAERLVHAQRLTARLLAAAPEVIVSSPAFEGEAAHRPSPLIAHLAPRTAPLPRFVPIESHWTLGQATELIEDAPVPLAAGEAARGGTSLIAHQAQCPFRAFAQHRLGARKLEQPRDATDPAARGSLIHDALQRLWEELGSKATLDALRMEQPPTRLGTLVAGHVADAIAEAARRSPAQWPSRLQVLEQARLTARLLEWLEQESARAPFTVKETERWHTLAVGGIELAGRIDRVDEVMVEGRPKPVYVDYKTGAVDWHKWFTVRPQDPQLPLYATCDAPEDGAAPTEAAAVLFAKVRVGEHGFAGVAEAAGLAPGVEAWPPAKSRSDAVKGAALSAPTWSALQGYWRENLTRLAGEYRAGVATVTPARDACRYCHLHALCRIDERGGPVADDEEGGR